MSKIKPFYIFFCDPSSPTHRITINNFGHSWQPPFYHWSQKDWGYRLYYRDCSLFQFNSSLSQRVGQLFPGNLTVLLTCKTWTWIKIQETKICYPSMTLSWDSNFVQKVDFTLLKFKWYYFSHQGIMSKALVRMFFFSMNNLFFNTSK